MSSPASRNRTRRATPWWRYSSTAAARSVRCVPRPRMSVTIATFGRAPSARPTSSSRAGIIWAGRLSTTNQSRSSRTRAAVDLPAPDIPVTRTTSGWCPRAVVSAAILCRTFLQSCVNRSRQCRADAVDLLQLLDGGLPDARHRPEGLQQGPAPGGAQAGDRIEGGRLRRCGTLPAMVGDRDAVRLVADPLQQIQPLGAAGEDRRVVVARQPDLLESLRQPRDRDVREPEIVECPSRR